MHRAPDHRFVSNDGENEVWLLSDGLLLSRVEGTLDLAMARAFVRLVDDWVLRRGAALVAFHDWESMRGYEMAARFLFASWIVQQRAQIAGVHFLVKSSLVELGVEMTNAAVGGILTSYTSREIWRAALLDAAAREGVDAL